MGDGPPKSPDDIALLRLDYSSESQIRSKLDQRIVELNNLIIEKNLLIERALLLNSKIQEMISALLSQNPSSGGRNQQILLTIKELERESAEILTELEILEKRIIETRAEMEEAHIEIIRLQQQKCLQK